MKIILIIPSADIGSVMNAVANNQGLVLEGEVQDLAGVLNPDAAYEVRKLESVQGILFERDWGYYAKRISGKPEEFLKAWVRWNVQEAIYDFYLEADSGEVFEEVFEHATLYVSRLY